MSKVLRISLAILIIIQFILIINKLKKKGLSMKYGSLWIALIIIMTLGIVFPQLFLILSNFLGFEKTSNMLFLFGFFFLFYMIFILTLSISKQKSEIVLLTQEVSILKKESLNDGKED